MEDSEFPGYIDTARDDEQDQLTGNFTSDLADLVAREDNKASDKMFRDCCVYLFLTPAGVIALCYGTWWLWHQKW